MTNILEKFYEKDLIQRINYRTKPRRMRAKSMGYMWEGHMDVILNDGRKFSFKMWNHFIEDDGSDGWYPSEKELIDAWRVSFITIGDEMYNATWHTIYANGNIYGSKKGFFYDSGYKKKAMGYIENGVDNEDVELII